jgi:GT2 family glycosyltransferase
LVIDNNSSDGSVEFIKNNYPEVTVFQNKKNIGYAKANNQGVRLLHSPYVIFCNQDIVLTNNWLETIMSKAESDEYASVGSFGGKLLKLKLIEGEVVPESRTDIIDSCGLKILRNRRIVELGAGKNEAEFNQSGGSFGHSGALVLYKRKTLEDILVKTKNTPKGEYFDEDFFSYKEDVDLAWRAQLLSWKSMFISGAVAYHARSASGSENISIKEMIKNRKKQSSFARYYSYRNHLLLLLKNEFGKNLFRDFWRIKWFEMKKSLYILIFEPRNIKVWFDILRMMPNMLTKRKEVMKKAKVTPKDIANWIK